MADIFDIFKRLEQNKAAPSTTPITHILVGLGNPGKQYTYTRHNAGFLCMDALAEKYGFTVNKSKFEALVGEATIAGARVLCMKPQTFMNSSGESVGPLMRYFKFDPEQVFVIYDDIWLFKSYNVLYQD